MNEQQTKQIVYRALKMYMARLIDMSHDIDTTQLHHGEHSDAPNPLDDGLSAEKYAVARIITGIRNNKITIKQHSYESFATDKQSIQSESETDTRKTN